MTVYAPPYIYAARCVRVIDGDTVELDVDLGFRIRSRMVMRLRGVNTPERGEPGWAEATTFVRDLLTPGWRTGEAPPLLLVATQQDRADKYGRMLVVIHVPALDNERSVNQRIIDAGHGVAYDGGAR